MTQRATAASLSTSYFQLSPLVLTLFPSTTTSTFSCVEGSGKGQRGCTSTQ